MRKALAALLAVTALAAVAATSAGASTWCGSESPTDRQPQVVPGRTVHFVYAYPSDAADDVARWGTIMQTDAELIDGWWRSQDATRTPRYDLYAFPCGGQLDITTVKLQNTTAELTPTAGRAQRILAGLRTAGLESEFQIDVIYFDGPDDGQGICGQGGTDEPDTGGAFAIVYTRGCGSESTAATAAHEMTHAFGAVRAPAPNMCPPPNEGHVCDSSRDLMYPYGDGTPLTSLVLDAGQNDYYGAPNVGFDVRTSKWLRHLDEPPGHLALQLKGPGTVASDLPGVQCAASCASDWDGGTTLTLTADAAPGKKFVRWGGACSGDFTDCAVTLTPTTTVTALFAPQTYALSLVVTGKGLVLPGLTGTPCRARCKVPLASYAPVTLRVQAQPGWRFKRWGGACHGTHATCRLPMTAAVAASAVFVKRRVAR